MLRLFYTDYEQIWICIRDRGKLGERLLSVLLFAPSPQHAEHEYKIGAFIGCFEAVPPFRKRRRSHFVELAQQLNYDSFEIIIIFCFNQPMTTE